MAREEPPIWSPNLGVLAVAAARNVLLLGDPQQLEQKVRTAFVDVKARGPAASDPDRTVPLHDQPLVSVVTDPEITRSNVSIISRSRSFSPTPWSSPD